MFNKAKLGYQRLEAWAEVYLTFVIATSLAIGDSVDKAIDSLLPGVDARGQTDTIIAVVVVGVVAVVGLLVYSNVESAVTLDIQGARDDPANATRLENASASVGDGFGDAIELVPIVLIVLVAAVVIGVISRFR